MSVFLINVKGSDSLETKKDISYYLKLHYKFEIQQEDDGTYFIEYPELKGCMSCGDTIDEAVRMGEDAKKCWLETCLEKGIYIPEPTDEEAYSGNFRIRMPKTLHKELSEKAAKEGTSMNQYCIYLLSKEFAKEEL